jgi:hypothetical protein
MKKNPLILERFETLEDAEYAKEKLEEAGLHPLILDETQTGNGAYALQVPESEVDEAEGVLAEAEIEEDEAWEEGGEEVI